MNNKLHISFFALLLLITIVKAQNVGINLDNGITPTATLDINGNLKVKHPDNITGKKLPFLYKNDDGKIVTGKHKTEGYMYAVQFDLFTEQKISDGGVEYYSDLIEKYDTKVPGDKYFMFVMGATLMRKDKDGTEKPAHLQDSKADHFPFKEVTLKRPDVHGNWILRADYPSGEPANNEAKYGRIFWRVKALVIKNEHIGYLSANSGNRDNSQPDDPKASFSADEFPADGTELPLNFKIIEQPKLEEYENIEGVGINTDKPKLELDVNGDMVVRDLTKEAQENLIPLFLWDKKDEEGRFGVSAEGKPFSVLSGRVNCKGVSSYRTDLPLWADWIDNFDTKIPTKTHTLMLADAYLDNDYYEEKKLDNNIYGYHTYIYGMARAVNPIDKRETMNAQEVVNLFKESDSNGEETWRIKADYPANPVCGRLDYHKWDGSRQDYYTLSDVDNCKDKYSWNFRLLAISNAFITDLGVFKDDLGIKKPGDNTVNEKNTPYDNVAKKFLLDNTDFVQYMLDKLENK